MASRKIVSGSLKSLKVVKSPSPCSPMVVPSPSAPATQRRKRAPSASALPVKVSRAIPAKVKMATARATVTAAVPPPSLLPNRTKKIAPKASGVSLR